MIRCVFDSCKIRTVEPLTERRTTKPMDSIRTYEIEVRGRIEERDLILMSPLRLNVKHSDANTLSFTVCTDQSGVIGLIRHLHGRGLVILSVKREA